MPALTSKPLVDLLDAFASPDPTPGGGSAAALASALGVSLAMMVAALPKTRSNTDDDRERLRRAHETLRGFRARLIALVDEDSAAYDAVIAAYRLPKDTEDQKTARRGHIQDALRTAAGVPLEVMQSSVAALNAVVEVARHASPTAASDVGVALALLRAGLQGAGLNVRINLEGLSNRPEADARAREADEVERQGAVLITRGEDALRPV